MHLAYMPSQLDNSIPFCFDLKKRTPQISTDIEK